MLCDSLRHNIETEFKCLVTAEEYRKIRAFYQNKAVLHQQKNVYYCDEKCHLQDLEAVLRNRIFDQGNTLTFKVKAAGELHEFEKDNCLLNDKEFLGILAEYRIFPPLIRQGEMITCRYLVDLPDADLCLDENHYNDIVDYELEYEIGNNNTDLDDFIALLKKVGITYRPNTISKYQRFLRSLE